MIVWVKRLRKKCNEWGKFVNNNEYDAVFMAAGLSYEQDWIQHSPEQEQDFAIASYETSYHEKTFKVLAKSKESGGCKIQ